MTPTGFSSRGSWRRRRTRRRADGEIETETELVEKAQFPTDIERAPIFEAVLRDRFQEVIRRFESRTVGLPLG